MLHLSEHGFIFMFMFVIFNFSSKSSDPQPILHPCQSWLVCMLVVHVREVWAWFFPGAASKGAAREHRGDRRRRRRWRRGTRRRRRRGRLEAAPPPPQSSPSLPVERRISSSCTNSQNPKILASTSPFSPTQPPPCCQINTKPASAVWRFWNTKT